MEHPDLSSVAVLIPAYKPDEKLLTLLDALLPLGFAKLIVVDDGGGPEYASIFSRLPEECVLLTHEVNCGKGRALKTGFQYLCNRSAFCGVVTADADGQHTPEDIRAVAEALLSHPHSLILGCRRFVGKVPLRSRLGNGITRGVFALAGVRVSDTQTGLRAMPAASLEWMSQLPGERYEYETCMLLEAKSHELPFYEVPIDTVYLDGNKSSHFHVLRDSLFIYGQIFRFIGSSLIAALVDFVLLLVFQHLTDNLLVSVVTARAISSLLNYLINRRLVFKRGARHSLVSYYALVLVVLAANYGLLSLLTSVVGFPLPLAKILTEVLLFFFSYAMQKALVFRPSAKG